MAPGGSRPGEDVARALSRARAFRALPAGLLAEAAAVAERVEIPGGSVLLRQDGAGSEYLWVIEAGAVHILAEPEEGGGERRLVEVCGPGDVFGAASVLEGPTARARFTVGVVEPLRALRIPRERVAALASRAPAFAEALQQRNDRLLRRATASLFLREEGASGAARGMGLEPLRSLVLPVSAVVRRDPSTALADITVAQAARRMEREGIGCLLLVDEQLHPIGILTDTDLRNRVVAAELPLDTKVEAVMSRPVLGLPADAPVLEALRLMSDHGVRHLVVLGPRGETRGVVSATDLLRWQGRSPVALLHRVDAAADLEQLADARTATGAILVDLLRAGVEPEQATRVITTLNDGAVRRALRWAEEETSTELGTAPPRFCWLALGSEGRAEQTLATDQDNAIVHAADPADRQAHRWLERFAARSVAALERIGFPHCTGNVMVTNPLWRRSLEQWRGQIARWTEETGAEEVLRSTIFFDLRPLHGDATLAAELRREILARRNDIFLLNLARDAAGKAPPLGLIRTFAVERSGPHRGTLDVKFRGIGPLVDCARVLALATGAQPTGTWERLRHAADAGGVSREVAQDALEAFSFLMTLRLQHQLERLERGETLDNHLNPRQLTPFQRQHLKVAFQVVRSVQSAVMVRLGGSPIG